MSITTEQLCQCRVFWRWMVIVKKATLFDQIRAYFFAVQKKEPFFIAKRNNRIFFVKRQIKKKLPRHILPSKLFFYLVEKYGFFNPFYEQIDEEKYFEVIKKWRLTEMKNFFKEHPLPVRHEKIVIYKRKPLR